MNIPSKLLLSLVFTSAQVLLKVKRYVCEYIRLVGRVIDALEDEKSNNMVTSRGQAT